MHISIGTQISTVEVKSVAQISYSISFSVVLLFFSATIIPILSKHSKQNITLLRYWENLKQMKYFSINK